MSYHFSFNARSKERALAFLDDDRSGAKSAPDCVRAFIRTAIENLTVDAPIAVSATGHLCNSPGSYEVSSAQLKVEYIFVPTFIEDALDAQSSDRA